MLSYFSLPGPGGVSPSLGLSMCPPLPNPTEPIPPASRDADFLSEIGISMPRARLGKYEGKLGDEAPISIYTTRMAEGGFGMSATTGNGANPLFKSTQVKKDNMCIYGDTLCSVSIWRTFTRGVPTVISQQ